ncbi:MAG: 6-phosphofructokinase [Clostridiales bacterium]|nr:MAG: 6-phosphofructokinase [Clostridiales bacterium]
MRLEGKVVIAQGGGPTPVINQSLVGAVLESRKFTQITRVYGAVKGIEGIVDENFIDLTQETTHNLEMVAKTPSAALLSTRVKPSKEFCLEIYKTFKAHNVRYFLYIGGNDSAETVRLVNNYAEEDKYEFRAMHIPKTIDNDLVENDHTPGYGSAARFVSNAFLGLNLENRALEGVHIGVVMGREAGFLTASSVLGKKYDDDGPHLIYIPEREFDMKKFLADVDRVYRERGRCLIAVSEGIKDRSGQFLSSKFIERTGKDAFGNLQLSGSGVLGDVLASAIREKLKISRVRADTLGYLQRSFAEIVSKVDRNEAREVGERAAQFAIWNNIDGSVSIQRTGNYSVNYVLKPLADIAGKSRTMPEKFINESGNGVTDEFVGYVRPLVGDGVAMAERLRAPMVKKIINKAGGAR